MMVSKDLSTAAFARKLRQILLDRDWTQSDLARHAFGEAIDGRGYKVPKGRQTISAIFNGKALPSARTRQKLARALGIEESELLPTMAVEHDGEKPEIEFKISGANANMGRLRVDCLVTYDTFKAIAKLLQRDKTATTRPTTGTPRHDIHRQHEMAFSLPACNQSKE